MLGEQTDTYPVVVFVFSAVKEERYMSNIEGSSYGPSAEGFAE